MGLFVLVLGATRAVYSPLSQDSLNLTLPFYKSVNASQNTEQASKMLLSEQTHLIELNMLLNEMFQYFVFELHSTYEKLLEKAITITVPYKLKTIRK